MSPRSPGAFLLSTTFHALVIGVACLLTIDSCQREQPKQRILELVAGEGDNYGATVAPKLGTPGGLKVDVPSIPVPEPQPDPEPPKPEPKTEPPPPKPEPVKPAPPPPQKQPAKETPVAKKEPDAIPNFSKQITRKVIRADSQAKREIAKQRAEEAKRLKKEEFDRQQRAKIASAKAGSGTPKISKIDTEGIRKGVIGGSAENKVGGAGGKALVRDEGPVTDAYYALLVQKVKAALDKPPGVSDELSVTVSFRISASGQISAVRVLTSSGSSEWDEAVVSAFRRVSMPDHPLRRGEELDLTFRTKDATED